MSDLELIDQQDVLQSSALRLVDKLQLKEQLSLLGEFRLVGSITLGLMVWPDIDMEVEVDDYDVADMLSVAKHLLHQVETVDVTLRDYRRDTNPNKPKGLYIGAKVEQNEIRWKIDIWLIREKDKQEQDITKQMQTLTENQKLAILRIKSNVWDNVQYRKKIVSVDIYDAVLNHGAESVSDFEVYLGKTGRSL